MTIIIYSERTKVFKFHVWYRMSQEPDILGGSRDVLQTTQKQLIIYILCTKITVSKKLRRLFFGLLYTQLFSLRMCAFIFLLQSK